MCKSLRYTWITWIPCIVKRELCENLNYTHRCLIVIVFTEQLEALSWYSTEGARSPELIAFSGIGREGITSRLVVLALGVLRLHAGSRGVSWLRSAEPCVCCCVCACVYVCALICEYGCVTVVTPDQACSSHSSSKQTSCLSEFSINQRLLS